MRRRILLHAVQTAVGALTLAGCQVPALPRTRFTPQTAPAPATPATAPAMPRQARDYVLKLDDLPPGFHLETEMTPTFPTTASDDPWGRHSAYSVTFSPNVPSAAPGAPAERSQVETSGITVVPAEEGRYDVVSSSNTYLSADAARSAMDDWRRALPRQYRLSEQTLPVQHGQTAVYVQPHSCLIGMQIGNVFASVWVGDSKNGAAKGRAGSADAAAPLDFALRLAKTQAHRLESDIR